MHSLYVMVLRSLKVVLAMGAPVLGLCSCSLSASLIGANVKSEMEAGIDSGDTPTYINISNQHNFTISGHCPKVVTDVALESPANLIIPCVNGDFGRTVDFSDLQDGNHVFTLRSTVGDVKTWVVVKDVIAPSATLTSYSFVNGLVKAPFSVTLSFSEDVTGLEFGDFAVTNAILTGISGGPSIYTIMVTPIVDGSVSLQYLADQSQDLSHNYNTDSNTLNLIYDSIAPTVILSSSVGDPFKDSSFEVTAVFSELVEGFVADDIAVTNGAVSDFSGTGGVYTFTITPNGQGLVAVAVGAGVVQDLAGNTNIAPANLTRTYDNIGPTITGLSNDDTWRTSKTWSWGCDEACNYRFVIDTETGTTPSGVYGFTTSTSQSSGSGTYFLHVQAQDAAGNTSITHVSALLDNTNPNPASSITDGTALNSLTQSPTITFSSGSDADSGLMKHQVRVLRISDSAVIKDWHDFTSGSQVATLSLDTNTAYMVEIKAIDNAGNESLSVSSDGWIADITAPSEPTALSVGSVPYILSSSPTLSWTGASDGLGGSGVSYHQVRVFRVSDNIPMSPWTILTSGNAISGLNLADGVQYYFKVRAVDFLGQVGAESVASDNWTARSAYVYNYTISSHMQNFNLRNAAVAAGWDQASPLQATVTVNAGVVVGSSSTALYSFDTGVSFPTGSSLKLVNNGTIAGAGGAGAATGGLGGGWASGNPGGPALRAQYAISITNNGVIAGGGGGGGEAQFTSYGGSGAGAGGNGLYGATSGNSYDGAACGVEILLLVGGSGGALGSAGESGYAIPGGCGVYVGGGGAAGYCAVGNVNITWIVIGTRLGSLN